MEDKHHIKQLVITVGVSVLIVVAIAFFFNFSRGKTSVPEEFLIAQISSANSATSVTTLVNDSLEALSEIESLDKKKQFSKALNLVSKEISKTEERQQAAVDLASQLEQMTQASATIRPDSSRQLAIEIVSNGVSIVSRLIAYNQTLDQLFFTLQHKFQSGSTPVDIQSLVEKLNRDAGLINQSNSQFTLLLDSLNSEIVD